MSRLGKALLYLVYLVIVGGLITAIILSFTHDKLPSPVATTAPAATHAPALAKPKTTSSSPAVQSNSGPAESTSSSAGQAASSAGQAATNSLANTGPGNIVAVFVGASVCGSIIYRKRLIGILK